jgi:hypothetical protein
VHSPLEKLSSRTNSIERCSPVLYLHITIRTSVETNLGDASLAFLFDQGSPKLVLTGIAVQCNIHAEVYQ